MAKVRNALRCFGALSIIALMLTLALSGCGHRKVDMEWHYDSEVEAAKK